MHHRSRHPLSLARKGIGRDGAFAGYASLFEREDLGRDIVQRGAFAACLARRGPAGIKMLWQHDPTQPIGTWLTIAEDTRGLRVHGRLLPGVARAREAAALLEAEVLDGLSIGFRATKSRRDPRSGVRRILEVDLWEISLVTFPLLPDARIDPAPPSRRASTVHAGTSRHLLSAHP